MSSYGVRSGTNINGEIMFYLIIILVKLLIELSFRNSCIDYFVLIKGIAVPFNMYK